eukprot:2635164-Rhodomonas_salina.1
MSGTDRVYGPTRICYGKSGTDIAYGAPRFGKREARDRGGGRGRGGERGRGRGRGQAGGQEGEEGAGREREEEIQGEGGRGEESERAREEGGTCGEPRGEGGSSPQPSTTASVAERNRLQQLVGEKKKKKKGLVYVDLNSTRLGSPAPLRVPWYCCARTDVLYCSQCLGTPALVLTACRGTPALVRTSTSPYSRVCTDVDSLVLLRPY